MTVTWQMFAIVGPLVMLASFIDSIAGGGGLISLPAYYLAGLPPVMAAGTNKLSACLGTAAASGRFLAGRSVAGRTALLSALGAFPGSWLGTELLKVIPEDTIRAMMLLAIPLVLIVVLRRRNAPPRSLVEESLQPIVSLAIGFVIGFYDGLVGPGTGTFLIILFTMVLGMDAVVASGTAKIVNLTSNVASLISQLLSGNVLIALGLPVAACSILGSLLGASMALKKGTGLIRGVLVVVMILLLGKMAFDLFVH